MSYTAQASTATPASSHSALVNSWKAEPACVVPTRCLSPCTARQRSRLEWSGAERTKPDGETGTSISRTSVREIPSGDLRLHKVSTYYKRKSLCSRFSLTLVSILAVFCEGAGDTTPAPFVWLEWNTITSHIVAPDYTWPLAMPTVSTTTYSLLRYFSVIAELCHSV